MYSLAKETRSSLVTESSDLKAALFGTSLQEKAWRNRHLRKGSDWGKTQALDDEWVVGYWNSRDHSHRPFLIERIAGHAPIQSILEVGSNCGPNLYLLAKKFPKARIVGIDINPVAVKRGNELFAQEGITNVRILEGRADQLRDFQDRGFDVVFTDAVLMYIGPDKIRRVVEDMLRISCKALLLLEWNSGPDKKDPRGLGRYCGGKWKRDYGALLRQFVREDQVRITKLPEDLWPDKNWQQLGACIEATMTRTISANRSHDVSVQAIRGST